MGFQSNQKITANFVPKGVNAARSGVGTIAAALSRTMLHLRGASIGSYARVSLQCRVFAARSVSLGEYTEVLRNSTIDGSPSGAGSVCIGSHCRLKENVWVAAYEGHIMIGDRVLIGRNCIIHGHGNVLVGSHTMLGPGCMIFSSDHVLTAGELFQDSGYISKRTVIGSNVWLGSGVIVTAGSVIEDNTAVAAGSVVHGHLESGKIYAGVPAKQIKTIPSTYDLGAGEVKHWHI